MSTRPPCVSPSHPSLFRHVANADDGRAAGLDTPEEVELDVARVGRHRHVLAPASCANLGRGGRWQHENLASEC